MDRPRIPSMVVRRPKLWKCSKCGRRFAKTNQWHSCLAWTAADHFRGKDPHLKKLYKRLVDRMGRFGPVRIDAVQRSINLISHYHFGGIEVRKDYLRIGFLSERVIRSRRIIRRTKLGPKRVGHTVVLSSLGDIDDQLLGWLEKAHALQSR